MRNEKTSLNQCKEPQNQIQFDTYQEKGPVKIGPWTSHIWRSDSRHLGFLPVGYKFCAKMLAGKRKELTKLSKKAPTFMRGDELLILGTSQLQHSVLVWGLNLPPKPQTLGTLATL